MNQRAANPRLDEGGDRIGRLLAVVAAVAEATDPAQAAATLVEQGRRALDAQTGAAWLLVGETLELVRSIGYAAEFAAAVAKVALGAPLPLSDVVRSGEPVWMERIDELVARYPVVAAMMRREPAGLAIACLPLAVDGRTHGVVAYTFDADRRFTDGERAVLAALARLAAQAVDRARLMQQAEATRAALVASEDRHRFLLDNTPLVICLARGDGTMELMSRSWFEYTGRREGEPGATDLLSALHPDDLQAIARSPGCFVDGQFEARLRLRRADGAYRWHIARARMLGSGDDLRWFGVAVDIDDQKRAEEALRFFARASAELASSLDEQVTLAAVARLAVPDFADGCAVDLLRDDQTLELVAMEHADAAQSAAAREAFRRRPPRPDDAGGHFAVLRSGVALLARDLDEAAEALGGEQAALRELGVRSMIRAPLVTRGRSLGTLTFVSLSSQRRYDASDLAFIEELARRAALAIDNARLYREAQAAAKIREEFLSIAGHELRTPLTALQLRVQMLQRVLLRGPAAQDPAVTDGLRGIQHQTDRLEKLINELLDVSRLAAGRLSLAIGTVDLAALAREVAARFDDEVQRAGCTLTLAVRGPVVGAWDAARLDLMLTNLLGNAIKYGAGAPIVLTVGAVGERAVLSVRDHGIGIAPENQARIFGRFERAAEENYGGFGLGLWIVHQIVEAHGGKVSLKSALGLGSTFTIELPVHAR